MLPFFNFNKILVTAVIYFFLSCGANPLSEPLTPWEPRAPVSRLLLSPVIELMGEKKSQIVLQSLCKQIPHMLSTLALRHVAAVAVLSYILWYNAWEAAALRSSLPASCSLGRRRSRAREAFPALLLSFETGYCDELSVALRLIRLPSFSVGSSGGTCAAAAEEGHRDPSWRPVAYPQRDHWDPLFWRPAQGIMLKTLNFTLLRFKAADI